jgi:hypothetical protein
MTTGVHILISWGEIYRSVAMNSSGVNSGIPEFTPYSRSLRRQIITP